MLPSCLLNSAFFWQCCRGLRKYDSAIKGGFACLSTTGQTVLHAGVIISPTSRLVTPLSPCLYIYTLKPLLSISALVLSPRQPGPSSASNLIRRYNSQYKRHYINISSGSVTRCRSGQVASIHVTLLRAKEYEGVQSLMNRRVLAKPGQQPQEKTSTSALQTMLSKSSARNSTRNGHKRSAHNTCCNFSATDHAYTFPSTFFEMNKGKTPD